MKILSLVLLIYMINKTSDKSYSERIKNILDGNSSEKENLDMKNLGIESLIDSRTEEMMLRCKLMGILAEELTEEQPNEEIRSAAIKYLDEMIAEITNAVNSVSDERVLAFLHVQRDSCEKKKELIKRSTSSVDIISIVAP